MSKVIDFLERLGRDVQLRHATGTELEQALAAADIEPAMREAILGGDRLRLEALLEMIPNVCCGLHPAREDEEEEQSEDEDQDDREDESDGDEESGKPALRSAASKRVAA